MLSIHKRILANRPYNNDSLKLSSTLFEMPCRNGLKWGIPEILRLQREYELLKYDVNTIAELHDRSVNAIKFKLVAENFATWDSLQ
jgi:hypothetical protein